MFPLNFLLLYLLTNLAQRSFVVPGLFDGYALAGAAFLGGDASGNNRLVVSVYNPDNEWLNGTYPAIMALHYETAAGYDSVLSERLNPVIRVLEMYLSPTEPLVGTVTGVVKTWTDTVVVTAVVNGVGTLVGFDMDELTAFAATRSQRPAPIVAGLDSRRRVMVWSLDYLPTGGVAFYRHGRECKLVVAGSDVGETLTNKAHVYPLANCAWLAVLPVVQDNGLSFPFAPTKFTFSIPGYVSGLALFVDDVDSNQYLAALNCNYDIAAGCDVSYYQVKREANTQDWFIDEDKPVYRLAVPYGSVGLGWDSDTQDFVIGNNGGSVSNLARVKTKGELVEDRIMFFRLPILQTVKPGVCVPLCGVCVEIGSAELVGSGCVYRDERGEGAGVGCRMDSRPFRPL